MTFVDEFIAHATCTPGITTAAATAEAEALQELARAIAREHRNKAAIFARLDVARNCPVKGRAAYVGHYDINAAAVAEMDGLEIGPEAMAVVMEEMVRCISAPVAA